MDNGGILLISFVFHASINHKYYKAMFNHMKNISHWNMKQKVSFIINNILLINIPVMILSSIVISKDVFFFIDLNIGNSEIWRIVHIFSAVIILCCAY